MLRFDCFAGNGVVAAGEEKEEGRKLLQTPRCLEFLAAARGSTCRQQRWRVEGRAATVLAPRNPAEHCSGLQKVFPVISRLFWGGVIVTLM